MITVCEQGLLKLLQQSVGRSETSKSSENLQSTNE